MINKVLVLKMLIFVLKAELAQCRLQQLERLGG